MLRDRDICKRFGARIAKLREERGWTQEDLEAKSHLARPYISQIETGKYAPSLHAIKALADSFGITVSKLTRGL